MRSNPRVIVKIHRSQMSRIRLVAHIPQETVLRSLLFFSITELQVIPTPSYLYYVPSPFQLCLGPVLGPGIMLGIIISLGEAFGVKLRSLKKFCADLKHELWSGGAWDSSPALTWNFLGLQFCIWKERIVTQCLLYRSLWGVNSVMCGIHSTMSDSCLQLNKEPPSPSIPE